MAEEKKVEFKDIEDAWGLLTLMQKGENSWVDYKRMTRDGTEFMLYHPHTEDYLKALNACGATLKINQMTDEVMFCGERLTQSREATIINNLLDFGFNSRQRILDCIQEAALKDSYHPLYDFFDSLVWDKQNRLEEFLSCIHFRGDTDWGKAVFKKWLLGSVAKIYQQAQLYMLVLDGRQGCGKSYLARWLCPLKEYFLEGPINPGDKDTDMQAISKWIWEVSELQSTTRRADREALKAHITRQAVTIRAPYGKYAMTKNVTASYLGTINQDAGFLEDDSGNRRFVIVAIDKIDWNYTDIDIKQLWAQIVAVYKSGKEWELTTEEEAQRDNTNKFYDAPHPVIELFLKNYDIVPDDTTVFTPTIDIITNLESKEIGLTGNQRANMIRLTAWLKTKGIEGTRVRTGGAAQRGFYGVMETDHTGPKMGGNHKDEHLPF
jgi:predicted P-loop ATPase